MENVKETALAYFAESILAFPETAAEYASLKNAIEADTLVLENLDSREAAKLETLQQIEAVDCTELIERQIGQEPFFGRAIDYFNMAKNQRLTDAHDVLGIDFTTLRFCRIYANGQRQKA